MAGLKELDDSIDDLFGTGGQDSGHDSANDSNTANEDTQSDNTQSSRNARAQQGKGTDNQQQVADAQQPKPKHEINLHLGSTEQQAASKGNTGKPGADGKPQGAAAQLQGANGQAPATAATAAEVAKLGGIVDRNGTVLARDATEARLYNHAQNLARQSTNLHNQLRDRDVQLEAYKNSNAQMTQLGLTPVEVSTAMQFMAHFRADPVAAAKKVIAEVMAMGHNLEGISGDTNHAAIKQMVQQAVQPFVSDRQATLREQQEMAKAQQQIDAVVAEKPWVSNQWTELDAIIAARPQMSLRDAAYELEVFALRNQLDMSQPLQPQIIARQQQQQQPAQQPMQQAQPQVPQPASNFGRPGSMPATSSQPVGDPTRTPFTPNGSMRTRDIVRAAMAEHGIHVPD